jgi:hypothetical protein
MGAMRVIMEHVGYTDEQVDQLMQQQSKTDHVNNINNKKDNSFKDYSPMPEEGLRKRLQTVEDEEEEDVFKNFRRNEPKLSWVLDITIAYPGGEPIDFMTLITGASAPCDTIMFYRLYPCSEVSASVGSLMVVPLSSSGLDVQLLPRQQIVTSHAQKDEGPVNKK